jgi:hypothetical protein
MNIIGYGEDALTYHILTTQMEKFLEIMEENETSANDAILFYRPSFGRGNIGEFDAIVGTQNHVYLIESKWHESTNEIKKRTNTVKLVPTQIRRHRVFAEIFEFWNDEITNWDKFHKNPSEEILEIFSGKIPDKNTKLAENMQTVISMLKKGRVKKSIINVILLMHPVGKQVFNNMEEGECRKILTVQKENKSQLEGTEFQLVRMTYQPYNPAELDKQDRFFQFRSENL